MRFFAKFILEPFAALKGQLHEGLRMTARGGSLCRLPAHLNDQRVSIVGDFSGARIGAIHTCPLSLRDQPERERSRHGHARIGSLPFSNMQAFLRVIPMQLYG